LAWQAPIEGTPWSAISADDRLFVVTREGRIACFGTGEGAARSIDERTPAVSSTQDRWSVRTKQLLSATDQPSGYALVLGAGTGRLAEELVRQSDLNVVVIEADASRIPPLSR